MSSLLLKQVRISDVKSSFHQKTCDVLIENGIIKSIATEIPANPSYEVVDKKGVWLSPGWIDMAAALHEPGFEYKEDLESLRAAAANGGFSDVLTWSETEPEIATKQAVKYITNTNIGEVVHFHPIAVATSHKKGLEMSEILDLTEAGAVAFSDGLNGQWHPIVIRQLLQYLQLADGLLIDRVDEPQLSKGGQMHEGKVSTLMGMRGIPVLIEEMAIQRNISLLKYSGGKIHFSQVSSARGLVLIKEAKAEGLSITCDVSVHHLLYTDEDLASFDTNLKVLPPFRAEDDRLALWEGVKDGTIDAIVSAHLPEDIENKRLEFDLAAFGIIGLETFLPVLLAKKPADCSIDLLLEKFIQSPRRIIKVTCPSVAIGEVACLTLFDPEVEWTVSKETLKSKCFNTPKLGEVVKGRAVGVIRKETISWNQ